MNSQARMSSQQVVRNLFSLPADEDILDDFSCALRKKIFIHGRLFCTDNYLCFYANILGFKTKQVIPFKEVITIRRIKGAISNSIEIACNNKKSYFFGSFLRRNEAFQFIYNLWKNSGYFDEKQDIGQWSDTEDTPPGEENIEEEEKEGLTMLPSEDIGDAIESVKVILPVTPQKFFDLFFADEAVFGFPDYSKQRGDTELETTPWAENEELEGFTREIKFRTKINGPSIGPKTTRCQRALKYKWTDGVLVVQSSTKALDVPYSSYFLVEDTWKITPISAEKSLLRITFTINFLKSTMLRSTIESRSKVDVTKDHENWLREARKKCLNEQEPSTEKPPDRIIHQIAKYEEVDLKAYREKSKDAIKISSPSSINSLLVLNTMLIVFLLFYLRYLNSRINEIYLLTPEQA
jgi:VAD1 Analog of StAR-related lipid transfer domain/GRAM domain